jgi:RNA polymerase sigma-70 factor (ECF subfamily)
MFDEHRRFIADMLRRAGVSGSDLDDQVQCTFIVAARRIDDVRRGAERGFLLQVALNTALHARRSYARRREVLDGDDALEHIEALATPESLAESREMRKLVVDAVDSMDESLRSVLTLSELKEMSEKEIAAVLGVPRGTVASRLKRARTQLRKHAAASELALDRGREDGGRTHESATPSGLSSDSVAIWAAARQYVA